MFFYSQPHLLLHFSHLYQIDLGLFLKMVTKIPNGSHSNSDQDKADSNDE